MMKKRNLFTLLWVILLFTAQIYGVTAPTGLEDSDATDHNITLTWTDTESEESYTIYQVTRSLDGDEYTEIGTSESNITIFVVTSVKEGLSTVALSEFTTYRFAVGARYRGKDNKPIDSDPSTPIYATTTHTWDGALLECINDTMGHPSDTIPIRTKLEKVSSFECIEKGLTEMEPVRDLKNLTTLDLNHNTITGSIPTWIGELTNLTYLNLHTNQLSGNIPSQIWTLTSLTKGLDLGDNHLTGSISSEIENLTSM